MVHVLHDSAPGRPWGSPRIRNAHGSTTAFGDPQPPHPPQPPPHPPPQPPLLPAPDPSALPLAVCHGQTSCRWPSRPAALPTPKGQRRSAAPDRRRTLLHIQGHPEQAAHRLAFGAHQLHPLSSGQPQSSPRLWPQQEQAGGLSHSPAWRPCSTACETPLFRFARAAPNAMAVVFG
jgi:hypothetical protein